MLRTLVARDWQRLMPGESYACSRVFALASTPGARSTSTPACNPTIEVRSAGHNLEPVLGSLYNESEGGYGHRTGRIRGSGLPRQQVPRRDRAVLLQGRDEQDPLFLRVKEATASVLEDHLPKSRYKQAGERDVQGQRMMQAASDIYLGWTKGIEANRFLYWRQLRDMKESAVVEAMTPVGLTFYAGACGWTLARAHARSGDPVALAEYLGKSDKFERAIVDLSERYAEQNDRDYQAFEQAIRSGRLQAVQGV
jgi:Uncharacterized protein conserved in bacteria (DUF2252)